MDRFSVCKAIISSFYLARRQRVPEETELKAETMIAVKDWQRIKTDDLLTCAERARQSPKFGQITNGDVLLENEKLLAQRAQERRRIENRRVLEGPNTKPANHDEIIDICRQWDKIKLHK